jgi:hypothetical protein
MGKYYQTAERNYRDNFIYQPPYELIQAVLAKKDADIQNQLNTIEILGQLPVDYWKEADQTNVENVQKKYEEMANSVAKMYQQDPLNPQNKAALNMVKKELSKDYQTGELSKISENIANYRQYLEDYEKLDDTAKAVYKKMTTDYLEKVGDQGDGSSVGALREIFKPTQMMGTKDFFKEWVDLVYKNLEPNSTVNVGYGEKVNRISKEKGLTATMLANSLITFLQQHQDVPTYAKNRHEIGEDTYLDENGNVSFTGNTVFGRMVEAAKAMAYKQQDVDFASNGRGSGGSGSGGMVTDLIQPTFKNTPAIYSDNNTVMREYFYTFYNNLTDEQKNAPFFNKETKDPTDPTINIFLPIRPSDYIGKEKEFYHDFVNPLVYTNEDGVKTKGKNYKDDIIDENVRRLLNNSAAYVGKHYENAFKKSGWSQYLGQPVSRSTLHAFQEDIENNAHNLQGTFMDDNQVYNYGQPETITQFMNRVNGELRNIFNNRGYGKSKEQLIQIKDYEIMKHSSTPVVISDSDPGDNYLYFDVKFNFEHYTDGNSLLGDIQRLVGSKGTLFFRLNGDQLSLNDDLKNAAAKNLRSAVYLAKTANANYDSRVKAGHKLTEAEKANYEKNKQIISENEDKIKE